MIGQDAGSFVIRTRPARSLDTSARHTDRALDYSTDDCLPLGSTPGCNNDCRCDAPSNQTLTGNTMHN